MTADAWSPGPSVHARVGTQGGAVCPPLRVQASSWDAPLGRKSGGCEAWRSGKGPGCVSWCSDVRAAMWHLPTLPSPGPSSAWSGHRSPTWPSALKELGAQTWYRLCPLTVQGAVPLRVWVVAQLEGEAENLRPVSAPPPPPPEPRFWFSELGGGGSPGQCGGVAGAVVPEQPVLRRELEVAPGSGGECCCPLLPPAQQVTSSGSFVTLPLSSSQLGSGTRGRGECSPVHRTRVHTRTHWRACPQMGTRGVTRHRVRLTRAAPLWPRSTF